MAPSRDRRLTVSAAVLYLLAPLLVSGDVGLQINNFTEELNQTITSRPKDNGTISNKTLSDGDLKNIKADNNNRTVVTEDNENFQDWENELRLGNCRENLLREASRGICGAEFYGKMLSVSKAKWCSLEEIIRPYNEMTVCLETWSNFVGCFYPNPIVQELFLEVHASFFQNCSKDDAGLVDAPQGLVLTLTLLPVSLIPGLVYVIIRKNKAYK